MHISFLSSLLHAEYLSGVNTVDIFVQVATAVQVFHNLGLLESTVSLVLETAERNVSQSIKEALDISMLSQTTSDVNKSRGLVNLVYPYNTCIYIKF